MFPSPFKEAVEKTGGQSFLEKVAMIVPSFEKGGTGRI